MDVAVNLPFIKCSLSCRRSRALLFYSIINALAGSVPQGDAAVCWLRRQQDISDMPPESPRAVPSLPFLTAVRGCDSRLRAETARRRRARAGTQGRPSRPLCCLVLQPLRGGALGVFKGCHFWCS